MDRFAASLDRYLTREQPEPTACECGNGLHYEIDRELGACADCRAEAEAAEIVRSRCEATIAQVTSRAWLAEAHYDANADALFVGAATEAPAVAA